LPGQFGPESGGQHLRNIQSPGPKAQYRIVFGNGTGIPDEKIHLGYFKLDKLK
jgi:hypothetical protein